MGFEPTRPVKDDRISSAARYDHFDTSPNGIIIAYFKIISTGFGDRKMGVMDFERVVLYSEQQSEYESTVEELKDFNEIMMMYRCAIREVVTKFEVLNDEFKIKSKRNPIRYINQRIKKPSSIIEKMKRRQYDLNMDSMIDNLHDIAGVRVVCAYGSDIYALAQMFTKQDDVKLLLMKDYIKSPKENGYRSLHLVIEVPVYFSDIKRPIKVEVQIRTMAMDFWASLEHHIRYKTDGNVDEEIAKELKWCADTIHETDTMMQSIYEKIQKL